MKKAAERNFEGCRDKSLTDPVQAMITKVWRDMEAINQ